MTSTQFIVLTAVSLAETLLKLVASQLKEILTADFSRVFGLQQTKFSSNL
jgi:hypothetical protein